MGSAILHFGNVGLAWSSLRQRLVSKRQDDCLHLHGMWNRLSHRNPSVSLAGSHCCLGICFEPALRRAIVAACSSFGRRTASHRIPLGLLLLSRQHLTAEQLRAALETQQNNGHGKLGEWLVAMGYVTQRQITAALARQWSCPVLRSHSTLPATNRLLHLPLALMQSALLIPVGYSKSTETLHVAFSESVDYNLLYAIEQMNHCHTSPCLAEPEFVKHEISLLDDQGGSSQAVFECGTELPEVARIVHSYCARVSASEVRVAAAGSYMWIRLFRDGRQPLDLLFRLAGLLNQ